MEGVEEDTVGTTLAHAHASDKKRGGKDPGGTFEKRLDPCYCPKLSLDSSSLSRERVSFIPGPSDPPQLIV